MHSGPPTRLAPRPFGGLRNRIQRSSATAVASLLPSEHGKRDSQDEQAGDNRPEATPTPRRLAVMGPKCLAVLQRRTGKVSPRYSPER